MDDLHKLAAGYFEKDRGVVLQVGEEEAERSAKARREAGRYTLEEAAFFVQTHGRARARSILNGLMDAVAFRTLTIYEPGLNGVYKTDVVRPWRDEAYWADLNDWLENNEPRIGPVFPNPADIKTDVAVELKAAKSRLGIPWHESARIIADECFDDDTRNKCRDCLIKRVGSKVTGGYAHRVMEIMQERNIHGPRGRIDNAGTICRDALQGKSWWANKSK